MGSPFAPTDSVELTKVRFSYLPGMPVLRDVSVVLRAGEFVCVLGANGSGKSTFARLLNGLLIPEHGTVSVFGRSTRDTETMSEIRASVAMVFQNPAAQMVAPTVVEDIAFGPGNLGLPRDRIRDRVDGVITRLSISHLADRSTTALSGGEQQLVAVAGALAMNPRILVLDEATSSLDGPSRRRVLGAVEEYRRDGVGVVSITHHMEEALDADRVIVMADGRIVFDGKSDVLFAPETGSRRSTWRLGTPAAARISEVISNSGRHCHVRVCRDPVAAADELLACEPTFRLGFSDGTGQSSGAPRNSKVGAGPDVSASPDGGEGSAVLTARGLSYAYGSTRSAGDGTPSRALDGVDLTVRAGTVHAILGASGSGKSTLLLVLAGLIRAQSGDVKTAPGLSVAPVFQNPEDQLFAKTVSDDVAFGPRTQRLSRDEIARRVTASLDSVGLSEKEFGARGVLELSQGEKRRVAIAGVLALDPSILLLDEPTSNLDPASAELLHRIIRAWVDDKPESRAVVLVTHDAEEALELADDVTLLAHARVAAVGPEAITMGRVEGVAIPYHVAFWTRLFTAARGYCAHDRDAAPPRTLAAVLGEIQAAFHA